MDGVSSMRTLIAIAMGLALMTPALPVQAQDAEAASGVNTEWVPLESTRNDEDVVIVQRALDKPGWSKRMLARIAYQSNSGMDASAPAENLFEFDCAGKRTAVVDKAGEARKWEPITDAQMEAARAWICDEGITAIAPVD